MAKYRCSPIGTQVNKANALFVEGERYTASNSLSVSGFNAETFNPGDEIVFDGSNGNYVSTIAIPNGGAADMPVFVRGEHGPAVPFIGVTGASIGLLAEHSHIRVSNFRGQSETGGCFVVDPTANGHLTGIRFADLTCEATTNADAFGVVSVPSDTTHMIWERCLAKDIPGAGNQGFTMHSDQTAEAIDCRTSRECRTAISNASSGLLVVTRGEFDANVEINNSGGTGGVWFKEAKINKNSGYGRLFDLTDNLSRYSDCDITIPSNLASTSYCRSASTRAIVERCNILNQADLSYTFDFITGGAMDFLFNTIQMDDMGTCWARDGNTTTVGGQLNMIGNVVDFTNHTASGDEFLCYRSTANTTLSMIAGNVFKNSRSANSLHLVQLTAGATIHIDFMNNLCKDMDSPGNDMIDNDTGSATAVIRSFNNIFDNCEDAYDQTFGLTSDGNVFCGSTPDEGDANGRTMKPIYVDEVNEDFRLAANSPYLSDGVRGWGNTRRPEYLDGNPVPDFGITRGPHRWMEEPFHPSNL